MLVGGLSTNLSHGLLNLFNKSEHVAEFEFMAELWVFLCPIFSMQVSLIVVLFK